MYISPYLYPLEGPRSINNSVAVSIPNTQILISNHNSH